MKMKNCSVVILAAGLSERMGREKFMLAWDASATFLEHISRSFQNFATSKIIAVLNNDGHELLKQSSLIFPLNFLAVLNRHPEKGRFFSLQSGLAELTDEDFVFVHNVDSPFVSPIVLTALLENIQPKDFIYPTYRGKGGHPLLISRSTALAILAEHDSGANLKDYLKNFAGSAIEVDFPEMLININTPEDYRREIQLRNYAFG